MFVQARYHEDEGTSVQWFPRHRTAPIVRVREHRRLASTAPLVPRKVWVYLKPETLRRFDRGAMVPTVWQLPVHLPAQNRRCQKSTSQESIWCKLSLLSRSSHLNPFFRSLKVRPSKKPCRKVGYRRALYKR